MTIAVAHNDSAEGRAALLHAAREANFQHTSMAVLHILGRQQTEGDPAIAALRVEIEQALHSAGLEDLKWDLHTAPDESGKAAALVELTNEVGAVLLVVGSRRRTPIGKFLLGSTVQRVVLDSPVAVLVVKAPLGDSAG